MPDEPRPKTSRNSQSYAAKLAARYTRLKADQKTKTDRIAELEAQLSVAPVAADIVAQRDTLLAEKRTGLHRSAFDKIADALKIRPEARGDLWDMAKLDTSGDAADEAAIKTAVEGKVKDRPYLITPDNSTAPLTPDANANKGSDAPAVGSFVVPPGALSDGSWMHANGEALQAAHSEKRTIVYQ